MRNRLLVVSTIILMVSVMPISGIYGQSTPEAAQGDLTPDIRWRIENNTLYISGKGVVPTTMFGAKSAWFKHKTEFTSVIIEEGITGIGQGVFVGYKNITSLTVAGSVKDIATNAFNTCKNLTEVKLKGATPPDISMTVFYKLKLANVKLTIPAGTKAAYEADPLWNKFGTIIESNQPAETRPAPVETLSEPCNIHLTRTTNFLGGGANLKVFLNDIEQKEIANGKTNVMQTDRNSNMLYIKYGKKIVYAIRRFDAIAGGDVHIEFSIFNAYMKIIEEESGE